MQANVASFANALVKGGRGIMVGMQVPAIAHVVGTAGYAVKPGQDTVIEVSVDGLRRNADVKTCAATLLVGGPPLLSLAMGGAPATTSISIDGPDGKKDYAVAVALPARPRNVTLRLEGGDVFFRHGDQLTNSEYDLPDFARELNAFLDGYQGGLPVRLRFVLTSDAPGSADVRMGTIVSNYIQTQTWTNPVDGTVRVDRSFDLAFGDVRDVELLPLPTDHSSRRLLSLTADAVGEFGPERSLGEATLADSGTEFASIDSVFGAAQAVRAEVDVQCVGVALVLTARSSATVYVGFYADAMGQPDSAQGALGETQFAVEPADSGPAWFHAVLPAPVVLRAGQLVWLVSRGIQGEVRLAVARATFRHFGELRVTRGGHLWRALSHVHADDTRALVRLVHLPGPENASSALEFRLRSARSGNEYARMALDPSARPLTVRVPLSDVAAGDDVRAEIWSHARGSVTLTNVIQEYE